MYLHIKVVTTDKKSLDDFDLTEKEIKDIDQKQNLGEKFYLDGKYVPWNQIEEVYIIETNQESNYIHTKYRINMGYPLNITDIIFSKNNWQTIKRFDSNLRFKNVTEKYLKLNTQKETLTDIDEEIFNHIKFFLKNKDYFHAVEESYKIVRIEINKIFGTEKASDAFRDESKKNHIKNPENLQQESFRDFIDGIKYLNMSIQFFRNEKSHILFNPLDKKKALQFINIACLSLKLIRENFQ